MKRFAFTAAALLVAALPASVQGQFAPVPDAQEYLNYVNASSAVVSNGLSPRVYVGPYQGEFTNSVGDAISNRFALYCVDYFHYANQSDGLVNAYGVDGSLGSLATTRFGNSASYLKAAYLSSLFETVAPAERGDTWSALHAAIWRTTSGTNRVADASSVVGQQAQAFFEMTVPDNFTGAGWYVLTSAENANADGQEFLVRTQTRSVPEPGSFLLLGTGLLFLVGVSRRRGEDIV